MVILDSVVEGALAMTSRKDADAFIAGVVRYLATGDAPDLSGNALAMFIAVRPAIDKSTARVEAGRAGGKQTGKQTRSKQGSKNEANGQANTQANAKQTGKQTRSEQEQEQEEYQPESLTGVGGYSNLSACGRAPAPFVPPTVEEVRAYFEANCLAGDPEHFRAHYAAQGWVRGNGRPVCEWQGLALDWSVEERKRATKEQAARARGNPAQDAPLGEGEVGRRFADVRSMTPEEAGIGPVGGGGEPC